MAAIDWNLISIIMFYSLLALFFYIKRKKVETQFKVFFLYKTKKFNNLMIKIANCCPRFWRGFGYVAILAGFVAMGGVIYLLAKSLISMFLVKNAPAAVSLVIPGVHISGITADIPFWYGIIALFIVIMVHEGAHGIVCAAHKLKIKSSGVGLMLLLPMAFVEPDERQLFKQKLSTQLSVFAAGTFSNIVTAGIVFLLMMGIGITASGMISPLSGVYFNKVVEGKPAALAGLQHGDVITAVDGILVNATDFEKYMLSVPAGKTVSLQTADKTYEVKTIPNPANATRAYVGIDFRQNFKTKFGGLPIGLLKLYEFFYWVFALNIGIGIINMLPLGPIDGGRMIKVLLDSKMKKKKTALKIFAMVTYVSLSLLLLNIIVSMVKAVI